MEIGKYHIGIDIGGTKIAAGLFDSKGQLITQDKAPSNIETSETMFDSLINIIDNILVKCDLNYSQVAKLGVALPGKIDKELGLAIEQNNIPWKNFQIVQRLSDVFINAIIDIENDVKAAAIAEYHDQYNKEGIFEYLTISTGICLATISDGELVRGNGFSGEVGLITAENGKSIEETASGLAIENEAKILLNNEKITTKEVFELWYQGDQQIQRLINQKALVIAKLIHMIASFHDPDMIVIGGSVINHNPKYFELILSKAKDFMHPQQLHLIENIKMSRLKGDNGIVGASQISS